MQAGPFSPRARALRRPQPRRRTRCVCVNVRAGRVCVRAAPLERRGLGWGPAAASVRGGGEGGHLVALGTAQSVWPTSWFVRCPDGPPLHCCRVAHLSALRTPAQPCPATDPSPTPLTPPLPTPLPSSHFKLQLPQGITRKYRHFTSGKSKSEENEVITTKEMKRILANRQVRAGHVCCCEGTGRVPA